MILLNPKYIGLFIVTACAMASCISDTSDPKPSASRHEVVFDIPSLSTRSNATTAGNMKESSFAVFGDIKSTDESSASAIDVFLNKAEVKYYPDSTKWICSTQRYWHPNAEHSFVAVHPYSVVHTVNANYLNNTLSFKYTLPATFSDTPDMLVATHRRTYKNRDSIPAKSVKFKFIHIMSRINFLVKCEAVKIKITKVELEDINKSGSYTITPASLTSASDETYDYVHSWSDISNNGTLTATLNVDMVKDDVLPLFPDNNALFVIPQPDNNEVIMNITYMKYDKEGNAVEEETLTTQSPIGGWAQGKIYTYSFTIKTDRKEIEMSVSVEDWESGTDYDVDVPRK